MGVFAGKTGWFATEMKQFLSSFQIAVQWYLDVVRMSVKFGGKSILKENPLLGIVMSSVAIHHAYGTRFLFLSCVKTKLIYRNLLLFQLVVLSATANQHNINKHSRWFQVGVGLKNRQKLCDSLQVSKLTSRFSQARFKICGDNFRPGKCGGFWSFKGYPTGRVG